MLYKVDAIVLRSRDLGEADKVLTLYSKEEGKLQAAARGARRPRNRMTGAAQALTHGQFMLFRGRGLDTVSQCQIEDSFQGLRDDLVKGSAAQYAGELLDLLSRERDRNESAFLLLLTCLFLLSEADDVDFVLRLYELRLLASLGFRPRLDRCAGCGGPVTSNPVFFGLASGGVLCQDCQAGSIPAASATATATAAAGGADSAGGAEPGHLLSRGTVETMRRMLDGDLRRAMNLRPTAATRAEMAKAVHGYILYHFDKLPRSLEFLETLLKPAQIRPNPQS